MTGALPGQPQAALPVAEAWVQKEPENAQAWAQLGQVLLMHEQHLPAIRVLEKALQLDPQLTTAQVALAATCLAQGQDERAMALLQQAMQGEPLNDPLWLLAAHHLVQAQTRLALLDAARQTLAQVEICGYAQDGQHRYHATNLGVINAHRGKQARMSGYLVKHGVGRGTWYVASGQ
jgi:predicted Zn-dependent protease